MNRISTKELANFLEEANKSTYANKDAPKVSPSRLKSEDYHFEYADLVYHDTYFGGKDFIGEEIVYKEGTPVWGMNYYGYILHPEVDEKEVYNFLRESLMQDTVDYLPIRGPKYYCKDKWEYINHIDGELDRFTGYEEIWTGGRPVYNADFHGGFIE